MADPVVLRAMLERGVARLDELVRAYGSEAAVVDALWSDKAQKRANEWHTAADAPRGSRPHWSGASYTANQQPWTYSFWDFVGLPGGFELHNCRCAAPKPPPPRAKAYLCLDCGAVHDVHFGSAPFGCSCGSARFGEMSNG